MRAMVFCVLCLACSSSHTNDETKKQLCGLLASGTSLTPDQSMKSCDGRYSLGFENAGNLILYDGADMLWIMGYPSSDVATMGADGNFVLYADGSAVASTQTSGYAGAYLRLEDGQLRVVHDDLNLWSAPGPLSCDGLSNGWPGCNFTGCGVCSELVVNYPHYFLNHPGCWSNSDRACQEGHYLPCSNACPPPTAADK